MIEYELSGMSTVSPETLFIPAALALSVPYVLKFGWGYLQATVWAGIVLLLGVILESPVMAVKIVGAVYLFTALAFLHARQETPEYEDTAGDDR